MQNTGNAKDVIVGVVGLGLMGSSIIASFLIAGHQVIAVTPLPQDLHEAHQRIYKQLVHGEHSGLLSKPIDSYISQVVISDDYSSLQNCDWLWSV
jgi:3-hydroxybutyryl-CoA dehydrogenase